MPEQIDTVGLIIEYESGTLSDEGIITLFQALVNSGLAWQLQGHYGRMAEHLIELGLVARPGEVPTTTLEDLI